MIGIYKITNKLNNKAYIGQSHNIEERWREHKLRSFSLGYYDYNSCLHKAIRKYGVENFSFEILEKCEPEQLNEREIYWIDYYQTFPVSSGKGYNQTAGGEGTVRENKGLSIIIYYLLNTNLSQTKIAELTGYAQTLVGGINSGKYHYDKNLNYPLRKFKVGRTEQEGKIKMTKPKTDRAIPKPSKEKLLIALHEANYKREEAAKKFKVSGALLRKWCNSYNFNCQDKRILNKMYRQEILGEEIKIVIKRPRNYKVAQIDPNTNEIIHIYKSLTEAALEMGCCGRNIYMACDKPNRMAMGYKWSLELANKN